MSLTPAQTSAFRAAGGFAPQDSTILLVGITMTLMLIFAAWAINSGYRGFVTGQLTQGQFGVLTLNQRHRKHQRSATKDHQDLWALPH